MVDVNMREDITEGELTRQVETQTAKIQSINWLALAVGSMGLSFITAVIFGRRALGNFFGLWVPTLMLVGIYNKLVKMESNLERNLLH